LIHRNTPLPASRSEAFSTTVDGQEVVHISVFQGEDDDVRYNDEVGDFRLEGLSGVKQGNEILVRFDLDLDGILKVTASERATGLEERITIDNCVSKFRSTNHEEAKARIDKVFAEAGDDADLAAAASPNSLPMSGDRDLSPDLADAMEKARELIEKSEQLVEQASSEDGDEMKQLVDKLRSAISDKSLPAIESTMAQLDDLVFYLQDA
jgi:molecular chaperone DnaK